MHHTVLLAARVESHLVGEGRSCLPVVVDRIRMAHLRIEIEGLGILVGCSLETGRGVGLEAGRLVHHKGSSRMAGIGCRDLTL